MALTLWLTGLPGSGKSTIAEEIKQRHPDFIILRMDELRKIATPVPTYSEKERDILYRSIVYFAKILTESGSNVIIDATGNLRKWRELARKNISSFLEIYLKCDIDLCVERERKRKDRLSAPKDIYKKAAEGWPVPGINVPYESPTNPEISVNIESLSVNEIVDRIEKVIKNMRNKSNNSKSLGKNT